MTHSGSCHSGSCLCKAVSFTLTEQPESTGICHCGMCRKWSGGVYLGVMSAPDNVVFQGVENIATYVSSEWAERGFCKTCGSNLYYRVTAPGAHHGVYHLAFGALDDVSGMRVESEIFIDRKPEAYAFVGDHPTMTEAEVMAMFAEL